MSSSVFEYYFNPEELEPYYSELVGISSNRSKRKAVPKKQFHPKRKTNSAFAIHIADDGRPNKRDNLNRDDSAAHTTDATDSVKLRIEEPNSKLDVSTESAVAIAKSPVAESENSFKIGDAPPFETNSSRVRTFFSVHAFGQYVFCQRAGILAAESTNEVDSDEPIPRLTFLPNFDREKIEEMLSLNIKKGLLGLFYVVGICMFLAVGILEQNRAVVVPLLVMLSVSIVWLFQVFVTTVRLTIRRRMAITAEARTPDLTVSELQRVNWWSMLKSGFEPVNYQRPFRHPELPLEGCPWRVLERDSQRIPVIRAGGDRLGNRQGELFPKYRARIVAYAILLEATGQVRVPYGLVFPHDNPNGLAIPITPAVREQVKDELSDFMQAITVSRQKQLEPSLPENRNRCDRCEFGKPKAISKGDMETRRKAGTKLVVLHNNYGDSFHCECSDRFGSVPPHNEMRKRKLVTAIE